MSTPNDSSAIAAQDEADVLEQQAPAVPEAAEDTGNQDPVRPHGDPLRPDGSEADRLEQDADGGAGIDEDEYPHESDDE